MEEIRTTRRALLAAVQVQQEVDDETFAHSLAELGRLADTLGLEVVGEPFTQKRQGFDPGAYFGKGKRAELKELVEANDIELIVIDHELTPVQAQHLQKECGAKIMDRTAVILEIFHRNARSRAARAQVEIVRLKYMAPRVREKRKGGDRVRGGGGGGGGARRGAGESDIEVDRRRLRDRIAELTEELKEVDAERKIQRARRQELFRVALVGYTNAGKSTLMRALTVSDVYVADKLFATLDTTVRVLQPETRPRILVSDTVGFIHRLPHGLVAAFKSTLDEALEASLLAQVIDVSDPDWAQQMKVTSDVLDEIGARDLPRILVFNKADRVPSEPHGTLELLRASHPGAIIMSALRPEDVARLRAVVVAHFTNQLVEEQLVLAFDRQGLRAEIYENCEVLSEQGDENGLHLRVRAHPQVLERLRARATVA